MQARKKFKKFISVAIVMTIIVSLFMPTVSANAAEKQKIEDAIEAYTDVENSPYQITNVIIKNSSTYSVSYVVEYSIPKNCTLICAVYDSVNNRMVSFDKNRLFSDCTEDSFYSSLYSASIDYTVKFFLVDEYYHPLGKSISKHIELEPDVPFASYAFDFGDDAQPQMPLKNDSGKIANDINWSLDTNGLLTISGFGSHGWHGKHAVPWDEYIESITSINIEKLDNNYNSTLYLPSYTFMGMDKVKSVTIPAGVYLADNCFYDMAGLETITFETNIFNDGYYTGEMFIMCPNLKEFVVSESDQRYSSVNGVLYSKDGTTLIRYPAGRSETSFTVPESVTTINSYAFEGAKNLKNIKMSNNVKYINVGAFKNCTSLSNINLSDSLNTIRDEVFSNCKNLTNIEIPESVESIQKSFTGSGLESIYIPKNTIYIYIGSNYSSVDPLNENFESSFANCENLVSFEVDPENTYYKSVDGILYSGDMNTLCCYPNAKTGSEFVIPDEVTNIGPAAFEQSRNLESVILGENVTQIDNCAFKNCKQLKNIDLKNISRIYQFVFQGCESLTTVNIPETADYIANGIFGYCTNLESITVSENNKNYKSVDGCLFGDYGYGYYNVLMEYPNAKGSEYTVTSVDEIDQYAFLGRTSLKKVKFSATMYSIQGFIGCTSLTEVEIPDYCTTAIGESAFEYCTSLKNVDLPESITYISYRAFGHCKNLTSINNSLSCNISNNAFEFSGLKSFNMPYSGGTLDILYGCYNLETIKYSYNGGYNYSTACSKLDNVTIYYPKADPSWTSYTMSNPLQRDAIKWVEYDNTDQSGGYYSTGTHTFTDLKPNTEYVVGFNCGNEPTPEFITSGTYYVDMLESDANGKITVNYGLKGFLNIHYGGTLQPFVLGPAETDVNDIEVSLGKMIAINSGEKVKVTLTHNGKQLKENTDYVLKGNTSYYNEGDYSFTIIGMGNYFGTKDVAYSVSGIENDVNGDGYVNISDATDIQKYIAGYITLDSLEKADINDDGIVSVDDVTYLQRILASID